MATTEKGERHLEHYTRHLESLGEPFEWLDANAMRALTGIAYYRRGLSTPQAALIQPAMFVRALAEAAAAAGVDLYERSPVTALSRNGNDWYAATPLGAVNAPCVILAVNGQVESFGFFQCRLMHVFTYASMTRELTAEETRRLDGQLAWRILPADPMGTEPRRVCRRLQSLRGWSHGNKEEALTEIFT